MKNIYYIALSFLFSIICTNLFSQSNIKTLPEPYKIKFDLDKISLNDTPKLSDIADSIEYIKLDVIPQHLLSFFLGIPYITKDFIIIRGSHKAGLLQYSRKGKFIRQISSKGNGPGEHIFLNGFFVNESSSFIYTFPGYKNSVDKFDFKTGKFIESTPIKDMNGKPPVKQNTIGEIYSFYNREAFTTHSPETRYQEIICNVYSIIDPIKATIQLSKESKQYGMKNQKIEKPLRRSWVGSSETFVWQDSGNKLNYWETFCDTAYIVGKDKKVRPRFIADFGANKVEIKPLMDVFGKVPPTQIEPRRIYESTRYLFFRTDYKKHRYLTCFDKVTGKHSLVDKISEEEYDAKTSRRPFGIINDIDGGFSCMGSYDNNIWFTYYNALEMIDKLTPEYLNKMKGLVKYPERVEKLKKFISGLTENDNPVIVIVHLKK